MDFKEHIVTAAIKLIKEKGFKKLRIDEIAKEADISKRTLYRYFKSKEELISFIILEKHKQIQNEIDKIIKEPGNELSKYENLLILVTNNVSNFSYELFDVLEKYPQLYQSIKKAQKDFSYKIECMIESGIQKGEIKSEYNSKIIAFLLIKLANSIFEPAFFMNNKITFEEVSKNLRLMVINGLISKEEV